MKQCVLWWLRSQRLFPLSTNQKKMYSTYTGLNLLRWLLLKCQNNDLYKIFVKIEPFSNPYFLLHALSPEDQSQGDLLRQWWHQDCAGDQEQDHLQDERCDRAWPEEDSAVAEGWPAVHLWGDERHQRCLPGHGPEDGRQSGHHLAEALAEGTARV